MKLSRSLLASGLLSACILGVAGADHNSAESLEQRLSPVGSINVMTEEQAAEAARVKAEQIAAAQADAGPVDGAEVYDMACQACHTSGIAGAPKIADAAAWAPRITQGLEVLIEHAINGYQGEAGVMPARGGNPNLTDEQVTAAVDHIISQSQ